MPAILKYSYLVSKLTGYEDYKKNSYYIVLIGTVLILALLIASHLCFSKFVATCMHYTMGFSLIFIVYWIEVIILLDFRTTYVSHFDTLHVRFGYGNTLVWDEFYVDQVRTKTMVWNLIVAAIGVFLLIWGEVYKSRYEFACGEYILDPLTKEYHIWDECERINDNCITVRGYQIKDKKTYHLCPDCREGIVSAAEEDLL